ncbi:MAG: hypothetical protein ACYSUH_07470 [Planctomycetota bacterium]|jgi:hypothetical protein
MITQLFKEPDGDCYQVQSPDADEFRCTCEQIILKDLGCCCEICQKRFCSDCGCGDYKDTGWFVCLDCQENPERIIDALLTLI